MIHILLLLFLLITLLINFFLPFAFPVLGIIINSFSIVMYSLLAVFDIYDLSMQDILSISVTFMLLNLINIYLQFFDPFITSIVIYAILLFISLIFCFKIFHEKRFFSLTNLRHSYSILPIGIALGYGIHYLIHFSQFSIPTPSLLSAIGLIVLIGISEEIFFRALIQTAVTTMTDATIAIVFTSILYSAFHFSHNFIYVTMFLLLSIIYSIVYSIWKNIYIAIGINIAVNITFLLLSSNLLIFAIR